MKVCRVKEVAARFQPFAQDPCAGCLIKMNGPVPEPGQSGPSSDAEDGDDACEEEDVAAVHYLIFIVIVIVILILILPDWD